MDSNENKYNGVLSMICNDLSSIKSKLSTNMKFHDTRYAQFFSIGMYLKQSGY